MSILFSSSLLELLLHKLTTGKAAVDNSRRKTIPFLLFLPCSLMMLLHTPTITKENGTRACNEPPVQRCRLRLKQLQGKMENKRNKTNSKKSGINGMDG